MGNVPLVGRGVSQPGYGASQSMLGWIVLLALLFAAFKLWTAYGATGESGQLAYDAASVSGPWPQSMPVAGVSYRQDIVRQCRVGDQLSMRLDPYGSVLSRWGGGVHDDPRAIILFRGQSIVGYVPRVHNWSVHQALLRDGEQAWVAVVTDTVGGTAGYFAGLRVTLIRVHVEGQVQGSSRPMGGASIQSGPVPGSVPPQRMAQWDANEDEGPGDESLEPETVWALNDNDEEHRPKYL